MPSHAPTIDTEIGRISRSHGFVSLPNGLAELGGPGLTGSAAPASRRSGGCSLICTPTARSSDARALPSSASTWAICNWTWSSSRQGRSG